MTPKQWSPTLTGAWVLVTHTQLTFLPVSLASTQTQLCLKLTVDILTAFLLRSSLLSMVPGLSVFLSSFCYPDGISGQPVFNQHHLCLRDVFCTHQCRACCLTLKDWDKGLPLFSFSSFSLSLHSAIGSLCLSMKAFDTLFPAEWGYTPQAGSPGPQWASFHFPFWPHL